MVKKIHLNLYKNNYLEKSCDTNAIVTNDNVSFILDDVKTSINSSSFTRENKEYIFSLDIKNKKSTYCLKSNNIVLDITVEKILYKKEKGKITLHYKIETDEEEFKIEINIEGE